MRASGVVNCRKRWTISY